MGKYDERRQQLGIGTQTSEGSKYDRRREEIQQKREAVRQESIRQAEQRKEATRKPALTPQETEIVDRMRLAPLNVVKRIAETGNQSAEPQLVDRPSYAERVKQRVSGWPDILKPVGVVVEGIAQAPSMLATREALGTENSVEQGFKPVSGAGRVAGQIIAPIGAALTTPGAALGGGALYNQAGNVLSRFAPKLGGSAAGRVTEEVLKGSAVGAATGVGSELVINPNASGRQLAESAAYGAGGGAVLGGLGRGIGEAFSSFMNRSKSVVPEVENRVTKLLELPEPRARGNANTVETPDVIYGEGRIYTPEPLGLPEGNVVRPTRLRTADNDTTLNSVMGRIRPIVTERMTPPLENPNELAKWVQSHLGDNISLNEVRTLQYEDLRQMAEMMRSRMSVSDEAHKVASELGYNLDELLNGRMPTLGQRAAQNAQERIYGVYPDSLPKVRTPQFNREVLSGAAAPVERVGRAPGSPVSRFDERRKALGITQKTPIQDIPDPEVEVEEILRSVQEPRIRDRVVSFLDEAEKAARERLKNRSNIGFTPQGGNDIVDYAIIGASKLAKGTVKLADFTEEMVKEFGERIRPQAQQIYQMAKEQLRQQERRASKEGKEALEFNESGIGDASTFEQKISRKANKKKGSFRQWWEKTRTQLVDDLAPLEGLEKRVRGRLASAEDSLYKSARMFKGVPEKAAQIVTQRLTPIVEAIEKAGHSAEDLGRYALAKHAKDVNAAGYKSGFTNAEIESVLIKYDSPEMRKAQAELVQINRDMLQELVDNGVVSRELAEVLNERWKNYIPLFRALDEEAVDFETGLSKAVANVANPIKTLKGSEKPVIDPLENMVKNIMRSTNAAERNKVAGQLIKLADIDTEGNFIRKLDHMAEVGRKNVVNVKVNGENVKYEVEPEVYKAMLNLDQESSNMIINMLAKPASLLRAGATLTPEFSLRNPMRDVIQAFVVSKSGFNPLIDFPVGIIQSISKGKLYRDWVDNLGAYGNIMSMDRNVHRQALEKVLGEPASKKFVNIVNGKSLIRLLRAISDTTESATKVGEYRAALRKGESPQEAAYRSRDIMDFARAGTGIRQTNKIVAFLNANIQGKSKLIRAVKENPVGTTTRALTAVTLPTIGIFALNKQFANETQRETIDNAPDWMRNSFWLMAIPGTDTVARIPKPFDLAAIFSNLPERALDFVYQNDKEAFDGFARQSLSEAAIPVQISGLLPFVEGMANYSFFRQGDIIPQRESGLEFSDQYDPTRTTETAKFLAKGAEKLTGGKGAFKNFSSPRIMDNTIQGLTAGLGKYATDAVDAILTGKVPFTNWKVAPPIVERPEAPAKKFEQQPLLRSFLVDPSQGGKVMDQFYTEIDKLSKEKSSNKLNNKVFGGTLKKPEYLPKEKNEQLKSLNKYSDDVSDINKQIREIEKSMILSPREKRKQIDVLMDQRMKIIKESVAKIKK